MEEADSGGEDTCPDAWLGHDTSGFILYEVRWSVSTLSLFLLVLLKQIIQIRFRAEV